MKSYGPYILPQIGSLREMTDLRVKDNPDGIAFFYFLPKRARIMGLMPPASRIFMA